MKTRKKTNRIIFHHSYSHDVPAARIRKWHGERGFRDIGYHYVIRFDGTIEIGRDLRLVGAHAKGRNYDSIGVCLTGNFFLHEPTMAQIEASQTVYHDVCRSCGKSLKIEFHRPNVLAILDPSRGAGRTNPCPGPQLDRKDFAEIVKRGDPFLPYNISD